MWTSQHSLLMHCRCCIYITIVIIAHSQVSDLTHFGSCASSFCSPTSLTTVRIGLLHYVQSVSKIAFPVLAHIILIYILCQSVHDYWTALCILLFNYRELWLPFIPLPASGNTMWMTISQSTPTAKLVQEFLSHLNNIKVCIQFTYAKETEDGKLLFLDVSVQRV